MSFRVLMIGTSLDSHGGISQLQKALINHWPDSHYVLRHLETHRDGPGIYKLLVFFKSLFSFVYLIVREKPHMVHAHFSINASIFRKSVFVLIAKFFGIKVLLQSHTGEFEQYFQGLNKFLQHYLRSALNIADALIILGTRDLKAYGHCFHGITPIVLKNPISLQERKSALLHPHVITVGSLGHRKGTYDLLKAIPLVLDQLPNAKFILVGDGDVEIVRGIVENNNLARNVIVMGWQDSERVKELYLNSSIFVLPSYSEGMPMAILEAMSFGLPVVSTSVNGIPDVVIDGETGFLIEPGKIDALSNMLLKLLSDGELREDMGSKGKQRVEDLFSHNAVIKDFIAVYDQIILRGAYA